jgi:hypothetical protein
MIVEWIPGIKPPRDFCPQEFCFHWRIKGGYYASGIHENLEKALGGLKLNEESQCGCSFGSCKRDKSCPGDKDWYESCEPLLEKQGLPWFYFICDAEGLDPEYRKAYKEYFNEE